MNQSDETTKIFVVFASGLCGEFIISMLTGMKDPNEFDRLTVTHAGSCHLNRRDEPEIVCRDRDKLQQLLQEQEYPTWLVKAHINIEDSDLLLERYPDSKVIAMTQDHPKGKQGFANYIWKAILAEWDNYGRDTYCKYSGENVETKAEITKEGIHALYKKFLDPAHYPIQTQGKMARYPGRYFTFPLDVLYNDRQGTIAMLEYISGENINDRALAFYDEYMLKQPKKSILKNWNIN
mgnify:CR=1 FL=1